jgi:hypothetical protein
MGYCNLLIIGISSKTRCVMFDQHSTVKTVKGDAGQIREKYYDLTWPTERNNYIMVLKTTT